MNKEAIQTFSYRISQASRSELVVILYDIACQYIEDAMDAIPCGTENVAYTENIRNCGRVIDQLIKGLDFRYDISNQLFRIYLYIKKELVRCLAHQNEETLVHLKGLLMKLRGSFYEVSKTDGSGPVMKNTQQVFSGLTYSAFGSSNEVAETADNRGYRV